jgi:hypothetical protein
MRARNSRARIIRDVPELGKLLLILNLIARWR